MRHSLFFENILDCVCCFHIMDLTYSIFFHFLFYFFGFFCFLFFVFFFFFSFEASVGKRLIVVWSTNFPINRLTDN